jgi:4-alpha-glucanotransferase
MHLGTVPLGRLYFLECVWIFSSQANLAICSSNKRSKHTLTDRFIDKYSLDIVFLSIVSALLYLASCTKINGYEVDTMTITFQIHYLTAWGQQLAITGNLPELGNGNPEQALPMHYIGGGIWRAALPFNKIPASVEYKYLLRDDNTKSFVAEWGDSRKVRLSRNAGESLFLKDAWRPTDHPDHPFYSAAFEKVIFKPSQTFKSVAIKSGSGLSVRFQIRLAQSNPGLQLAILGNIPALGNWDLAKPFLLGNQEYPLWSSELRLNEPTDFEYKYGWYDPKQGRIIELEGGSNRRLEGAALDEGVSTLLVNDEYYANPKGNWKGAGVAIPVFSLRSEQGLGVGEFLDLKRMADWASKVGLKLIQVLPVNDTTANFNWMDSYPYSAISVFALHPQFLNLEALGENAPKRKIAAARKKLNASTTVDYPEVARIKTEIAREIYAKDKNDFLANPDFQTYFKDNKHWLEPYAVFSYLRDLNGAVDFNQWGAHAKFSPKILKELATPESVAYDQVAFFYFVQYHLDKQLREASAYAASLGVVLKGDLPIGIYRYSVDAWVAPHLYNMEGQAGAPPDPFSDNGQNWGFPTYRWEVMAEDNYLWWRQRMQHLARYFSAYRIDHILGFFRIWDIPYKHIEGLPGIFNPAIPVERNEFASRSIDFDYRRFCLPHITESDLQELFGEHIDFVKQTFFGPGEFGTYSFLPQWEGQRAIQAFIENPENNASADIQAGLFELVANVLLWEVPGSDQQLFHPRIMMDKTRSFKKLPYQQQQRLFDLHNDYFFRRQDEFWKIQAMKKLPALKASTDMLICGEDLGMVPATVPGVMKELGILSLEIQRMSKNPATEFLQAVDIPYWSVCSPSTHDMSTIRGWWEESERGQIQRFFEQELHGVGEAPISCEPAIAQAIIDQHLNWPSMWSVFPLQDLLAINGEIRLVNPDDERINVPANPKHHWCYRMHLTLENLISAKTFNDTLAEMLQTHGRN